VFPSIEIESLPIKENLLFESVESHFVANPEHPTFLVLGNILSEKTRRELRNLSLENPLFFIEVNNALNHLSIQREAKMLNRVLRIITPSALSPEFSEISVNFVAGNADFISVFENVQFELKGTPAVAEVELLSFLLNIEKSKTQEEEIELPDNENPWDSLPEDFNKFDRNLNNVSNIAEQIGTKITRVSERVENVLQTYSKYGKSVNEKIQSFNVVPNLATDKLAFLNTNDLLHYFVTNIEKQETSTELEQSFLNAFLTHHPEYNISNCFVVSGSARTALSLLGYHCGIEEAISVDLSWTYEHCFPKTESVPLNDELGLDSNAIIQTIQTKLAQNPNWKNHGAVVLNNPHNASGQVFEDKKITELLQWLLENDIYVIDDLSYQNGFRLSCHTDL